MTDIKHVCLIEYLRVGYGSDNSLKHTQEYIIRWVCFQDQVEAIHLVHAVFSL